MLRRDFHVVYHMGGWNVKKELSNVAEARFDTQLEAMAYGRDLAKYDAVSLIIHGRDGKFREVWSYD